MTFPLTPTVIVLGLSPADSDACAGTGAACDVVGIWGGAFSGHMKVSFQAARSIG
jgi:hypothetical protein